MSDTADDDRRRIRERKMQELRGRLEDGPGSDGVDAAERTGSPNEPIAIEDGDHLEEVVESDDVVLVDCYADWCGPCRILEPTIVLYADGDPVERLVGAQDRATLEGLIEQHA